MKPTQDILRKPLAVAGCVLGLAACSAADDVANLGVYYERAQEDADASTARPPQSATDAATAANGRSDAGASGQPAAGPACARTACIGTEPFVSEDAAVRCVELKAPNASPPLPPGQPSDHNFGFVVPAPVQSQEYLRSITPIIDNRTVLHHMKLYERKRAPVDPVDGPAPRRLVYSWAPGEAGLFLHPSIGIAVTEDLEYSLEIHYAEGAVDIHDGSGFNVCFTATAPEYLVSVSSIRALGPAEGPVTASCSPEHTQPIQLLAALPESMPNGRHVKLARSRPGQGEEVLLDRPYDHELSTAHVLSATLKPGDTLDTRCELTPPARTGTMAECAVHVLHWPAHTLVSATLEGHASALESCGQSSD